MKQGMVLGLTGQSGSGKSTVCKLLRKRCPEDLVFIDCDLVARQVVEPGTRCLEEIGSVFSPYADGSLLLENGGLNRRKLGGIVFTNKELLQKLNDTIFPYIREEIDRQIELLLPQYRLVILDAPTLFESGADSRCEKIVSVIAPHTQRVQRICKRDGITEEAAKARLASQYDDRFYIRQSDFVISNSRDIPYIQQQLDRMLYALGLLSGHEFHGSLLRRKLRAR